MKKSSFLCVGVGASAGGLSVLKKFVSSIPVDVDMAFIIVQHLDPTHDSMLTELLAKDSKIPVQDATNDTKLQPGHVYVIPPNKYLAVKKGKLKVSKPKHIRGHRKAIDHLFESLADQMENRAAGIILSGAGSDGTAGLKAIKANEGLCIVQDPLNAQYDSMPQTAIDSGYVDKVLAVEEMMETLLAYSENFEKFEIEETNLLLDSLEEIGSALQKYSEFDIHQYKTGTVNRRVIRRMGLTGLEFKKYLEKLENEEEERRLLVKDLMINVTNFFRDPEAFKIVEGEVLNSIVENLEAKEELRIWIPGCASGEEAYSIAILAYNTLKKYKKKNHIKVFATDIDEEAIALARKGLFPASLISDVPQNYIDDYFTEKGDGYYQIKQHIRDLIAFASHNVVTDPPFSKMHLISCRNLLIYLRKEVQQKVLNSMYFALNDDGFLFLGSSETAGSSSALFKTISKKWRIFQKKSGQQPKKLLYTSFLERSSKSRNTSHSKDRKKTSVSRSEKILSALQEAFMPPCIVVNQEGTILYTHGDIKPFIRFPNGEPKNNLFQLAEPSLRSRLRSGIFKARKSNESVLFNNTVGEEGDTFSVNVRIENMENVDGEEGGAFGIVFEKSEEKHIPSRLSSDDEHKAAEELERELAETKEELQNTIEELETSSEELKSSHEEALSTNEELQSANEELEASSEELRSLNEELNTLNSELKEKVELLQRAHNDLENFIDSSNIATIFLNTNMEIKEYTPAAEHLLKMGPQDIGRSIETLGRDLVDQDLQKEGKQVLLDLTSVQKEVESYDGRWFIRQITPYKTEDRRIEGVVVVFHEVTEIKKLSERAESREQQQAVVAKLGMLALSGADPKEIMNQAVRQICHMLDADFCKVLKYQPDDKNLLLEAGVGWQEGLVGKATVPDSTNSQAGYTLISTEPVLTLNALDEKRFSAPELLKDHNVVSGMSCLIGHPESPYGVLGVHTKKEREFTEDDANFFQSVANLLYVAILNRNNQQKLEESQERLTLAREAGHIGIHDYDIVNNRISWDRIIRNIWGVSENLTPITYSVFEEGVHPDDREYVNESIQEAISPENGGHFFAEYRVISKEDGKERWVEATGEVVFKDGKAVRLVGTVQEVTDTKNLELSLQEAVDKLEQEDEMKNQFLSILGHELRNPLGAISIILDAIAKEDLQNQAKELNRLVPMMKKSVGSMSKLLDELLDITRVAKNQIVLEKKPVNLNKILMDIIYSTEKIYAGKNQTLDTSIKGELHTLGDPLRLEQIFNNLLVNASKYSPEDKEITLDARKIGNQIVIKVTDEGMGIDPNDLDEIFQPFYQVNKEGEAASGLGLGLALAKNLVELHDGTLEAISEGKNKGSSFIVRLPYMANEDENKKQGDPTSFNPFPGFKILIIEDNSDILFTLKDLLESYGCEVHTASSGKEGLELFKEVKPHTALIDIGLPDMTGHEIATELRSKGFETMLVAVSGYSHNESRKKSDEVGFDYHLAKPMDLDELFGLLAKVER